MKLSTSLFTFVLSAAGLMAGGCATAPSGPTEQAALQARSHGALEEMKVKDSNLQNFLSTAYGYALFPSVGKGAFIVGGGYGRGEVWEQGKFVGYADMTQATVGLQAGGQTFSELIVFQDKDSLDRFKYGKMKFNASASAVALKAGASAAANYSDGVAVFTMPEGGLMFEAAIGGQEFGFVPSDGVQRQDVAADNRNDNWNWNATPASGKIKADSNGSVNTEPSIAPSTRPVGLNDPANQD